MPKYDFRCQECQNLFELNLSLAEREGESEKKKCPSCSSSEVKQVMSFNGGVVTSSKGGASSGSCPTGTCPFA